MGAGGQFFFIFGVAALQGAQAGLQLVQVKRFGQIVVGPAVQAHHPVPHGATCGEDQHRRAQPALAARLQHLQAIHAGQAQVQHHGVWRVGNPLRQRLAPVPHRRHQHAAPRQRTLQRGAHGGVVFNKQESHGENIPLPDARSSFQADTADLALPGRWWSPRQGGWRERSEAWG